MINAIANPQMPEIGEALPRAPVVKTTNFGAFVSLVPSKDGLLHHRGQEAGRWQAHRQCGRRRQVGDKIRWRSRTSTTAASWRPGAGARRAEGQTPECEPPAPRWFCATRGITVHRTDPLGAACFHGVIPPCGRCRWGVGADRFAPRDPSTAGATHFLEHLLFQGHRTPVGAGHRRRCRRWAARSTLHHQGKPCCHVRCSTSTRWM